MIERDHLTSLHATIRKRKKIVFKLFDSITRTLRPHTWSLAFILLVIVMVGWMPLLSKNVCLHCGWKWKCTMKELSTEDKAREGLMKIFYLIMHCLVKQYSNERYNVMIMIMKKKFIAYLFIDKCTGVQTESLLVYDLIIRPSIFLSECPTERKNFFFYSIQVIFTFHLFLWIFSIKEKHHGDDMKEPITCIE